MKNYERQISSITLHFESAQHSTLMFTITASASKRVISSVKLQKSLKFCIPITNTKQNQGFEMKVYKPGNWEELQTFFFLFQDIQKPQSIQGLIEYAQNYIYVKRGESYRCVFFVKIDFETKKLKSKYDEIWEQTNPCLSLKSHQAFQIVHYNLIGKKYYQNLVRRAVKSYIAEKQLQTRLENDKLIEKQQQKKKIINSKSKISTEKSNIAVNQQFSMNSSFHQGTNIKTYASTCQRFKSVVNNVSKKWETLRNAPKNSMGDLRKIILNQTSKTQEKLQKVNVKKVSIKKQKRTTIQKNIEKFSQQIGMALSTTATTKKRSNKHVKWNLCQHDQKFTYQSKKNQQITKDDTQEKPDVGNSSQRRKKYRLLRKKVNLSNALTSIFTNSMTQSSVNTVLTNYTAKHHEIENNAPKLYYTNFSQFLLSQMTNISECNKQNKQNAFELRKQKFKMERKKSTKYSSFF